MSDFTITRHIAAPVASVFGVVVLSVTALVARMTDGQVICKSGAEGYFIAVVRNRGLGVALKIADGASRASMVAICAVLQRIGALSNGHGDQLHALLSPPVLDSRGRPAGMLRPSPQTFT